MNKHTQCQTFEEVEMTVAKAMRVLYQYRPFYYHFLSGISKQLEAKGPAAAWVSYNKRTREIKVHLNFEYVQHYNYNTIALILEHEAGHLCLKHLIAGNQGAYNAYPKDVVNKAQDFIINDSIDEYREQFDELMSRYVSYKAQIDQKQQAVALETNPEIQKKMVLEVKSFVDDLTKKDVLPFTCIVPKLADIEELKGRVIRDMTTLELCSILHKDDQDQKENNQEQKDRGETLDSHDQSDEQETQGNEEKEAGGSENDIPQHAIDNMMKQAAEKTENQIKGQKPGTIPSFVSTRLESLEKSKVNFRKQLLIFAQTVINPSRTQTWARQNRRYPNQIKGSRTKQTSKIVVWVDTSGSNYSVPVFQKIAGHLKALSGVCGDVEVLFGDVTLHSKCKVGEKKFSLEKLDFKGGGGTDPQFVFEYAKKNKADGVILFTDGEIPEVKFTKKVLAVLTGSSPTHVQGAKNIQID